MARLSDWYRAAVKMVAADRDENEVLYKEAVKGLLDLVEDLPPGVGSEDVARSIELVERHPAFVASSGATMGLAVDIAKLCLASFKKGELLWKEAAHRNMEESRGVIQMEIAVEKAEFVELLRKQVGLIDTIPVRDLLVELFNQPAATEDHPIVHFVEGGTTACPMTFVFHVPGQFPKHHTWVSHSGKHLVSCVVCKRVIGGK